MLLKSGYSYNTVVGNINVLERELRREQAVAAAYNHARKCYFKRYPAGALPVWLSFPKSHRIRQYYNADGSPQKRSYSPPRSNPARISTKEIGEDFSKAKSLFTSFTGRAPATLTKIRVPAPPKVALAFGTLVELTYQSERDGRLYRHTFRKSSRPLVVASPDGKQLQIVGGRFAFTDRGIVDK